MRLMILLLTYISGVLLTSKLQFLKTLNTVPPQGKIWAVLVAGSTTWHNYRHQADVCHAYQILHNHGIPDENIVVMLADTIAYHEKNPTPGVIIHWPNGSNVYQGVPLDYTGDNVLPETLLEILRGDQNSLRKKGSGKFLNSGPKDNVFIYIADHGIPGAIYIHSKKLTAQKLNKEILNMYNRKKYSKMLIYVEACEGGSMFEGFLPDNINVLAVTASNATESSYSCIYDRHRKVFIADLFTLRWMQNSESIGYLNRKCLGQQFCSTSAHTTLSQVTAFGDLSIMDMPISDFQGRKPQAPIFYPDMKINIVRSGDVSIESIKLQLKDTTNPGEIRKLKEDLLKMKQDRKFVAGTFRRIVELIAQRDERVHRLWKKHLKLKDFRCYEAVVDAFQDLCFHVTKHQHTLKHLYMIVNMCELGVNMKEIKYAVKEVCSHSKKKIQNKLWF